MRILKILLLYILLPLTLLVGSLLYFISTETGIKTIFNIIPKVVSFVQIGEVTGHWNDLTVSHIDVNLPGIDVKVDRIHLSLNSRCLRNLDLCLNVVSVNGVNVDVITAELAEAETEDARPLTHISLPFKIALKKFDLQNIKVKIDNTELSTNQIDGSIIWDEFFNVEQFNIDSLYLKLPNTQAHDKIVQEGIETHQPVKIDAIIEQIKSQLNQPVISNLPAVILPMDFNVPNFVINHSQIDMQGILLNFEDTILSFNSLAEKVDINNIISNIDYCVLESTDIKTCAKSGVTLNGSLDMKSNWPINLNLLVKINDDNQIFYPNGLDLAQHFLKLNLAGELTQEIQGDLVISNQNSEVLKINLVENLSQSLVPMRLDISTNKLVWPMVDLKQSVAETQGVLTDDSQINEETAFETNPIIFAESYRLTNFVFKFVRQASSFDINASSTIQIPDFAPTNLSIQSNGDLNQIKIQEISLSQLTNNNNDHNNHFKSIKLTGEVGLSSDVIWSSELEFNGLNYKNDGISVSATGKATSSGLINSELWKLRLNDIFVDGFVNDHNLILSGNLAGNSENKWRVDHGKLVLGSNSLLFTGAFDKTISLDLDVEAPKLGGIIPELSGSVGGRILVTGNFETPKVEGNLKVNQFKFNDIKIKTLDLSTSIDSENSVSGQLSLKGSDIEVPNAKLSSVDINLTGSELQHELSITARGEPIGLNLRLNGAFDRNSNFLQSTINRFDIDTSEGIVKLNRPVVVTVSPEDVVINEHCWVHEFGQLCLLNRFALSQTTPINLGLQNFDMGYLNTYLSADTRINGMLDGRVIITPPLDKSIQAEIEINGRNLSLKQSVDNAVLKADFTGARINSKFANDKLELAWLFALTNNGSLQGEIEVSDILQQRNIKGQLSLVDINLNILQPLFAQNEKVAGSINSALRFSGNTQQPLVNGNFTLEDLNVVSYRIPFDITDSNLDIAFLGQKSTLDGEIVTNDGKINLSGSADWHDINNWHTTLNADSERLGVVIPPIAQIRLQPSIQFDATKERMLLTGNVDIPWARITVDELPEAVVEVSDDQVLLDADMNIIEQKQGGFPLQTNLNIRLGEDIQLNAFGLVAMLTGNLNVTQAEKGVLLFGEINTTSGGFRAYGQDLVLRKGIITFAGTPDRPKINVEAIRNPANIENEVIAGVRVSGFSDDPRIELFSIPMMSQEEILSYILRGQGLDVAGADSGLMTAMLIGMGTSQSGQLLGRIGETFGVQNLTLDTQGSGDNSQVVVSGDIFPGLQVRYGVGIFDSLATITLRYQLMPRLYLEAVSGLDQAIDLLYQFEFN